MTEEELLACMRAIRRKNGYKWHEKDEMLGTPEMLAFFDIWGRDPKAYPEGEYYREYRRVYAKIWQQTKKDRQAAGNGV